MHRMRVLSFPTCLEIYSFVNTKEIDDHFTVVNHNFCEVIVFQVAGNGRNGP